MTPRTKKMIYPTPRAAKTNHKYQTKTCNINKIEPKERNVINQKTPKIPPKEKKPKKKVYTNTSLPRYKRVKRFRVSAENGGLDHPINGRRNAKIIAAMSRCLKI